MSQNVRAQIERFFATRHELGWGAGAAWRRIEADAGPDGIRPYLPLLVENDFFPSRLFVGAPDDVVELIEQSVASCPASDARRISGMLEALAQVGRREVDLRLARGEFIPEWVPKGARRRAMLVDGYELDRQGNRRPLFGMPSLSLGEVAAGEPTPHRILRPLDDACPLCGTPLRELFAIEDAHLPSFSEVTDRPDRLRFVLCEGCIPFTPFYCDVGDDGRRAVAARRHDHLEKVRRWASRGHRLPEYEVGTVDRIHDLDRFWELQNEDELWVWIGGPPLWWDRPPYLPCPTCKRSMVFVGQFAVDEDPLSFRGDLYALWCTSCGKTACASSDWLKDRPPHRP